MARTRRRKLGEFHKKDPWPIDHWRLEWETNWVRGFYSTPIHFVNRDGSYEPWRECYGPNSKRWEKRLARRAQRRRAKRIVLDQWVKFNQALVAHLEERLPPKE